MEKRGLIREAVSRGMRSQGFQFYLADHPEDEDLYTAGKQDIAYRRYLTWQGAQFSDEIGVLFSPTDLANALFPPQRVIDEVLDRINSDELQDIWGKTRPLAGSTSISRRRNCAIRRARNCKRRATATNSRSATSSSRRATWSNS